VIGLAKSAAGASESLAPAAPNKAVSRSAQRGRWATMRCWTTVVLMFCCTTALSQTTQDHVHQMSHGVMPFDMSKTVHIFKMTEFGGIQRVVAKDPIEADQVALIRQHLQHEAERFQRGDYSDPATLHGQLMPGLIDLQDGGSRIKVSYLPISEGAEISFETTDLHLLTAIHRWFGAQLSEHGADARAD